MSGRGLRADGTIAREGALDRVAAPFAPVVHEARTRIAATFGDRRMHSAYLYGSIPRGTAVPGISDLDLLVALHEAPTDADRRDAAGLEAALDRRPEVDGVGLLLFDTRTLLSDLERHDLGFFVACLCTPLLGDDLAAHLPRYRPTPLLARETNGALELALPRWRRTAADPRTDGRALGRQISRRLVRTGFTLVMPRYGGWASDLSECAGIFGGYHPERADQMRAAAVNGRTPSADPAVLDMLIGDLGPWLAGQYTATHGTKAPRP